MFKVIAVWRSRVTAMFTLFLILKDTRLNGSARIRAALMLLLMFGYFLSPLDIIPDAIPMAGWLDDLVMLPVFALLSEKVVPEVNLAERRQAAEKTVRSIIWRTAGIITGLVLISLGVLGGIVEGIIGLIRG